MKQNYNLETMGDSPSRVNKSNPILPFESDCLPFGTSVLVLAR
jgi:hypothetical protein